ncbi:hypothetical protein I552_2226 [Mycobacterium xenopi 3993]|nr:hypothetical protein I552_2226 [Mycobacterium xenopi 3993]
MRCVASSPFSLPPSITAAPRVLEQSGRCSTKSPIADYLVAEAKPGVGVASDDAAIDSSHIGPYRRLPGRAIDSASLQ